MKERNKKDMSKNTSKTIKVDGQGISVTNKKDSAVNATVTERKTLIPKDIDATQYVVVRNGFQGRLVYRSKKTGERFVWDSFGAEQEMELRELRNAKNTYKKFFENNWFMFEEDWIVDYLGVRQFYKNAISIDEFDNLFLKSADEIKAIVSELSTGQKKSAAYRARQLIIDGQIDSHKAITALEESLGVELIEK